MSSPDIAAECEWPGTTCVRAVVLSNGDRFLESDKPALESRTYNSQHRPLTVTDASGQTTTYTYTALGQISTVTNAKSETTTFTYDATTKQLLTVNRTGNVGGHVMRVATREVR